MELLDAVRPVRPSPGTPQSARTSVISPVIPHHPAVDTPPRPDGEAPMDIVYIKGFTGQTVIGIDVSELRDPQPVRINLTIGVPSIRACVTDRIEDTVNYAAV